MKEAEHGFPKPNSETLACIEIASELEHQVGESKMPLHHRLHRIVILSVIVNLLPVLENKRPVRIEAVCLDSVFHVICSSLVERGSLDVVGNADPVSIKHRAGMETKDKKARPQTWQGYLQLYVHFILLAKAPIGAVRVIYPHNSYITAFGDFVELAGAVERRSVRLWAGRCKSGSSIFHDRNSPVELLDRHICVLRLAYTAVRTPNIKCGRRK